MSIQVFSRGLGSSFALVAAAMLLGNLIYPLTDGSVRAAETLPIAVTASPAIDPQAQALYLKSKQAEDQLSYMGRLNTTYWRTGHTTSVIVRHLAPSSLRIDYVEPDAVRGRAVVVQPGNEWTLNPGRRSFTHRAIAAHTTEAAASLALLTRNYILKVLPQTDLYIQRKTSILEVMRRSNKTLARKFWIDQVTGLVLKREVLSEDGKLTVTIAYSDINFHPQLTAEAFDLTGPASLKGIKLQELFSAPKLAAPTKPSSSTDYPAAAAGFKLVGESTRVINHRVTQEAHYSDGLDFLSLFEQKRVKSNRPTVVPKVAAPISINNKSAHLIRRASLETLIWDSGPLRLTVVGEANHNRMVAFAVAIDQFVSNSKLK